MQDTSVNFLGKYWRSIKHQWKPSSIVFLVLLSCSIIFAFTRKPTYTSEGKLSFRRTAAIPTLTGLGKEIGDLSALLSTASPLDNEVEIIRSQTNALKVIDTLKLEQDKGMPIELKDFYKKLKISPVKGSDILQISYEDKSAEKSAEVVNEIMRLYLEDNTKNFRENTNNALQFIEKQLPEAEERVKKAELSLQKFREQNKLVSLQEEQLSSVQLVFSLKNELRIAQTQIVDTESQIKTLQEKLGVNTNDAVILSTITQSKGFQDLLAEKQKIESDIANERARYLDSHPTIQLLIRRLETINALLQKRMNSVVENDPEGLVSNSATASLQQNVALQLVQLQAKKDGLNSQIQSLIETEKSYQERISKLPKIEQQQRELTRVLEASQATYNLLLTKSEELKIAEKQTIGTAIVIANALVPNQPTGASKVLFIIVGVLIGGMGAIATAVFLDSKDKVLQNTEDALQAYRFPLLGEIPIEKDYQVIALDVSSKILSSSTSISKIDQNPIIRDASQILGLNLKVLNIKQSIKIITVTSVEDQEGKSTIAAYLAASLAQLGEKVVLLDANLHKPTQHHLWSFDNHLGLKDVLLNGIELDLAMAESMSNLSLLSSGSSSLTSHPLTILDTGRMKSIIHDLSQKYDYVIIDTPAIHSHPDALFLSKFTDGILLVVRPNISTTDSAAYLQEVLEKSGQTVFAQIVNGL